MLEMIQDSFEITSKNFNLSELLLTERFAKKIEDFYKGEGSPKLLFYFQPERDSVDEYRDNLSEQHFQLVNGDKTPLNQKAIYFLRTAEEGKGVNMNELDGDILFGEVSENTLNQINMMMNCVFQPMIEKMTEQEWGDCDDEQKKDFLGQLKNFSSELDDNLSSIQKNMQKCRLDRIQLNELTNELDKIGFLEKKFEEWLNYFKVKIDKNEKRQKMMKSEGPKSELEYWKKTLQEVQLLMELTKTEDFQYTKNALMSKNKKIDDRKTKLINDYKEIDNLLTDKINEAKDNVKYLSTLEKFIEPLYTGTPDEITETLPALMNAIKMIHTISRHYNTSQKLTGLFLKITN